MNVPHHGPSQTLRRAIESCAVAPNHRIFRVVTFLAVSALLPASHAQSADHHYGLRYDLTLDPGANRAEVSLTVDERVKDNIQSMRFHIEPARHSDFSGDGSVTPDGEYVTWTPPETGGQLRFDVIVSNQRPNGRYDSLMQDDWAVFRGDDLFPPAHVQDNDVCEADATLHVHLPTGWSFASSYADSSDNIYEVEHAHRRFDRPTGWMAAGRLGVRRERIAGTQVIVAGPVGQGVRRMDIVALLNWNLPRVRRLVPEMPKRLFIVSAGDPMWRGGLSGPGSVFLHADRPLLSENGSSTLVHELIHVATRLEGETGADWIVEGMAEYYSLKILWRSGTITDNRYQEAFDKLAKWGEEADRLDVDMSRGPVTARAVVVMRALDREIYKATKHEKSFDDVVRLLTASGRKVNLERLRAAVAEVTGASAKTLSNESLGLADGS